MCGGGRGSSPPPSPAAPIFLSSPIPWLRSVVTSASNSNKKSRHVDDAAETCGITLCSRKLN